MVSGSITPRVVDAMRLGDRAAFDDLQAWIDDQICITARNTKRLDVLDKDALVFRRDASGRPLVGPNGQKTDHVAFRSLAPVPESVRRHLEPLPAEGQQ